LRSGFAYIRQTVANCDWQSVPTVPMVGQHDTLPLLAYMMDLASLTTGERHKVRGCANGAA